MLLSGSNWKHHRFWFLVFAIGTILSTVWFFGAAIKNRSIPEGSSPPGYTFGVLGGLLITFCMLLSWKKKYRTMRRVGQTQGWMRAHIWLGLLTGPLLIYHSGFKLGSPLSASILILLVIVLISGIWGLYMQNRIPTMLLHDVPAETIYSQMGRVKELMYLESERMVGAICGPTEKKPPALQFVTPDAVTEESHITIGRVRTAGLVQGKVVQTRTVAEPISGSEPLREFFDNQVTPYLMSQAPKENILHVPGKSAMLFQDLRTKLDPKAHEAVATLEGVCDQRRQFEHQARLYFWLHNWLWVHQPLSWILFLLMFLHVVVAHLYW